jgi:hypothetical protein
MKPTRQLYIRILLISVTLFILGQFIFKPFFEFLEPGFDLITFNVIEIQKGIRTSILFSLTLFLIPIFILLIWRLSQVTTPSKKTESVFVILFFIAASLWIRHIEVKSYYTYLLHNNLIYLKDNLPVNAPIDPVNFVYYMFGGLCIGCIFSYFLVRQKNMKDESIKKPTQN